MGAEPESLVTQEMIEAKGKWSEPHVSLPIASSDIRKWAIAVYWPETPPRLYWDEGYAKTTRYQGIIAPLDFNPFAWPVKRRVDDMSTGTPIWARSPVDGRKMRGLNGGEAQEYFTPMEPGDVITSSTALVGWHEKTTRLGLTLFALSETRWTNQKGELVKISRNTGIRF